VLQLINGAPWPPAAKCSRYRNDQRFIEALASQAALRLTNQLLIVRLETLFESFIKTDQYGDR